MLNLVNLLIPTKGDEMYYLHFGLSVAMIILMAIAAITAIVLVLLQPSNSSGIDALGGSSETFFGKNEEMDVDLSCNSRSFLYRLLRITA